MHYLGFLISAFKVSNVLYCSLRQGSFAFGMKYVVLIFFLPWRPFAADDTFMGDDREENTVVGIGVVEMFRFDGEFSAFVTYKS